jgi:DeoR/GlpR family transcriptional regulator of sugar metabolism
MRECAVSIKDAINDTVNDTAKKRLVEEMRYILLHGGITLSEIIERMKVKRATAQRDMKYLKKGSLVF